MKRTIALAFASLLAMSAPAQAARYLKFSVSALGRGTVTAVVDTSLCASDPNCKQHFAGVPSQIYWTLADGSVITYDNESWSTNVSIGISRSLPPQYPPGTWTQTLDLNAYWPSKPVDFSASSFNFGSVTPPYGSWQEYIDVNIFPSGFASHNESFPITGVSIEGSDSPLGALGIFYDWHPLSLPESSTWAMMIVGVGATGGMMRRKRGRTGTDLEATPPSMAG